MVSAVPAHERCVPWHAQHGVEETQKKGIQKEETSHYDIFELEGEERDGGQEKD